MNYDSQKEIAGFLEERGLALQKRFGQNFLVNRGAREKLIEALAPDAGERVWEIGPGIGSMTVMLLERGIGLTVFEIDRGFVRVLEELFGEVDRLRIRQGDVLETWRGVYEREGAPDRIFGNLPYNAASAIIHDFIRMNIGYRKMVFTVQKEAAQRMAAAPGTPNYSSFSIICQFSHEVRVLGDLKAGSFYPAPDVVSSIVEFVPAPEKEKPLERGLFFDLVQLLFTARRKTIRNNIRSAAGRLGLSQDRILEALSLEGIDPSLRGERLSPLQIVRLSNRLSLLRSRSSG